MHQINLNSRSWSLKIFQVFILTITLGFQCLFAQHERIDGLKRLLFVARQDTAKMKKYRELYLAYRYYSLDTAKLYLDSAILLSQQKNNNDQYIRGLNLLSVYWFDQGKNDSALITTQLALDIPTEDLGLRVEVLNKRGWALFSDGSYDEAINYFLQCQELAQQINDSQSAILALNNLGNIFLQIEDIEKAIEYYTKAVKASNDAKDETNLARSMDNLALAYKINENYKKALELYLHSDTIFQKLDNEIGYAIHLQNIGYVYKALEKFNLAESYFLRSKKLYEKNKDSLGIAQSYANFGTLETLKKNYVKAISLYDSAVFISSKLNNKYTLRVVYANLAELYYSTNDYKKAYDTRLLYEDVKDELLNENYLNKISDLEAKYEFEKNQREILALSEENLIQEAAIQTRDFWIRLLFVALFFLVCIALLTIMIIRQKMQFKNKEQMFNAVSNTEIKEQHRIARDLHDSIGAMLAVIKNKLSGIDWQTLDSKMQFELKNTIGLISKTSDETRRIAHNMMPDDLMKFGLISATESLLDNVKGEKNVKMTCDHFGMEQRMDRLKELNIFRIIQELIQNSLKHADPKTIHINFTRHHENLNIIMQDDGKGMPQNHSANPGLGLSNIQSRLKLLNAKWRIDSHQNQGTSIVLDIPVKS